MKERIENKLNENIERILEKEELLASDVAILKEELSNIKLEESKEQDEIKRKELIEVLIGDNGFANVR